jgi:hypothetical protein
MLEDLEAGFANVVRVTRRDEVRAAALVRAQIDKSYSLLEAVGAE